MGGYGALLASKSLGCFALVTAPQTCISNKSIPLHPVWRENIQKYPLVRDDIFDSIKDNRGAVVVYDNFCNIDRHHFAYISAVKGVVGVKVSFGTHYIPRALVEMGLFSQMITKLILNKNIPSDFFRKDIRENRILSKTYLDSLMSRLNKRDLNSQLYGMMQEKLRNVVLSKNTIARIYHIFLSIL